VLAEEVDGGKAFVKRKKQKEGGMEIVVVLKTRWGTG
jgi:hypothetical protein